MSRRWMICSIILVTSTLRGPATFAQTPEQDLRACMLAEIEKYQPKSSYEQEFKCSVGNKQPFQGVPSAGPTAISIRKAGHIFLSASAYETFKISDGGFTEPFISPKRDEVSSTIWCRAEDKLYGKTGKFNFIIYGELQRLATKIETRKALQLCSKSVNGLWNSTATGRTQ